MTRRLLGPVVAALFAAAQAACSLNPQPLPPDQAQDSGLGTVATTGDASRAAFDGASTPVTGGGGDKNGEGGTLSLPDAGVVPMDASAFVDADGAPDATLDGSAWDGGDSGVDDAHAFDAHD